MKLSIIIVNYKTYRLTKQTIQSVLNQDLDFKYEIILVDNASRDGSMEELMKDFEPLVEEQKLKIFFNDENLGFAKANNRGIRHSKGEYILLLNSDTYILEDCLNKALSYIEEGINDPKVGALGCKIILPDGTLDHACKRGFPTPKASVYYFLGMDKKNPVKYGQYDALHLGEDETGEVDVLMGAFMLMPKVVLDEVGLLDENFFMYGEDIDLCYRIKEAGYGVVYYPEAQIIHYKGGSSKKRRTKVIYDFHHAMWLFYKKHYIKKYPVAINSMVFIGIFSKYLLALLKNSLVLGNKAGESTLSDGKKGMEAN